MGRCLRRIEHKGDKVLCLKPFIKGLKDGGFEMTNEEARDIFDRFNSDGSTHINMVDFLAAVRVSCE